MALDKLSAYYQNFVEEINYDAIEKLEIVGEGSFGTVYKGRWNGKYVAVKHLVTEVERSFLIELRQMSRVNHPNIIKLYGACTKPPVCLVMEYAEGGSLYNALHGTHAPKYNAGHAISWCLQCAKGVAYLHNMKPKALIHRDLKPPNLLLESCGRILKICDFGTACDLKTNMTNNKGSAAWMAPEVFEGSNYTEKCDIFSWGIILWEVLSRQKPFNEVGGNALRVMWSVHQGKRPPPIEGCPKQLEILMNRCWAKDTSSRPSMDEIVNIMSSLLRFFPGYDEPLIYEYDNFYDSSIEDIQTEDGSFTDIPDSYINSQQSHNMSISGTMARTDAHFSAPLSLNMNAGGESCSSDFVELPNDALRLRNQPSGSATHGNTIGNLRNNIDRLGGSGDNNVNEDFDDKIYLTLEPKFRPLEPDMSCEESVQTFEAHKEIAKEYLKVQTELAYVAQKLQELQEEASHCETSLPKINEQDEVRKLREEKDSLLLYYKTLKSRLDEVTSNNAQKNDWVFLPQSSDHPT